MTKNNIHKTQRINAIMKDVSAIETAERKAMLDEYLKQIENEDQEHLLELFKVLHKTVDSKTDKKLILDTWKNKALTLPQKAHFLAKYIADSSSTPSANFIQNVSQSLAVLKTDAELDVFLANPQTYIDTHKSLPAYDLQILQIVINDLRFNNLPSVNRQVANNTYIYTPLTSQMHQLNLPQYASTDATRFPQCINPDVKEEVLAKSKKEYHGPKIMGLAGAMSSYHRAAIKQTAINVKKMQMGACHTFAQLAADHFLSLIENAQLDPMPIKMVSHQAALGSHTFLLVNHTSNDLTDLSHCLIVDPWAVAMGHTATYGIYTIENYPYPDMTGNLACCYDNQAPVITDKENKAANESLSQELQSAVSNRGFFARRTTVQSEENLSVPQQKTVAFITELASMTAQATKKSLMSELITAVKHETIPLEKVIRLAAFASQARFIEQDGNHYKWRKSTAVDESTLPAFNNPAIFPIWKRFIKINNIASIDANFKTIDANMLSKIVNFLNENEDLDFNKPKSISPRI